MRCGEHVSRRHNRRFWDIHWNADAAVVVKFNGSSNPGQWIMVLHARVGNARRFVNFNRNQLAFPATGRAANANNARSVGKPRNLRPAGPDISRRANVPAVCKRVNTADHTHCREFLLVHDQEAGDQHRRYRAFPNPMATRRRQRGLPGF